ncbi:MAG: hypothetical protein HKP40_07675 [Litoreibacter sp.]|nr:hypothetical protein [Litoreibacter sp.]
MIPVLGVLFTIYFFSTIWNSPWTAQVSTFLVGSILLFTCGLFFLRCFMLLRSGEANLGFGTLFTREDLSTGRYGLLATTVGYCVLIETFGFTLTTFAFLFLSMVILSKARRIVFTAMISAIMALGGWAVFIWAFDTRFPRGIFENFMETVLG